MNRLAIQTKARKLDYYATLQFYYDELDRTEETLNAEGGIIQGRWVTRFGRKGPVDVEIPREQILEDRMKILENYRKTLDRLKPLDELARADREAVNEGVPDDMVGALAELQVVSTFRNDLYVRLDYYFAEIEKVRSILEEHAPVEDITVTRFRNGAPLQVTITREEQIIIRAKLMETFLSLVTKSSVLYEDRKILKQARGSHEVPEDMRDDARA